MEGEAGEYRAIGRDRALFEHSDEPPGTWTHFDFDDRAWARHRMPYQDGHGFRQRSEIAMLAARASFQVDDPNRVGNVQLNIRYRGGAVVYLNGREVARHHLPAGELTADTLSDDYPREAFVTAENRRIPPPGERGDEPDLERRLELRIRQATVTLPAEHLRAGRNVVAIAVHRAPIASNLPSYAGGRANWSTLGLLSANLQTEPRSGISRYPALLDRPILWNADPLEMIGLEDYDGHAGGEIRPIQLVAARGGSASGQIVVSVPAGKPIQRLEAQASGLQDWPSRATLTGDHVRVRFAAHPVRYGEAGRWLTGYFDILATEPEVGRAIQPVWVTVNVPADQAPGQYVGTLAVSVDGQRMEVPINLRVSRLQLPSPSEGRTFVAVLQSPDTVAMRYDVPLYSDDHFRLLEPSMKLLGQLGNRVLYLTAINRTHFGNENAMIQFRRVGAQLVPDFSALDRYLELYDKHVGPPRAVVVQVFSPNMNQRGRSPASVNITVRSRDGRLSQEQVPFFGRPGSREIWAPVIEGLQSRLRDRNWPEEALMIGIGADTRPQAEVVEFFRQIDQAIPWVLFTHARGDPSPGARRQTIGPMEVGYRVLPDVPRIRFPSSPQWSLPEPGSFIDASSLRGFIRIYSPPGSYYTAPSRAMFGRSSGLARIGLDFWPREGNADHHVDGLLSRYRTNGVLDRNLMRDNPRTLTAPGPDGAVPTVRFEMLREGIQLNEARLLIEEVLADEQKRSQLSQELRAEALQRMTEYQAALLLGALDWAWMIHADRLQRAWDLFETAADVAEAMNSNP